jgi:hypothetical protein
VISARSLLAVLLCVALPGCYVATYGNQSVNGGATATTTSSQVGATAKFSAGRASFSSGQAVAPGAAGGQVSLSRGGSAIVAVGLVVAETVHYLGALFGAKPQPAPPADSIADTCSCYRKSDEVMR